MQNPQTDIEFLEALLDAEIDPAAVLPLIDMWLNGSQTEGLAMLTYE